MAIEIQKTPAFVKFFTNDDYEKNTRAIVKFFTISAMLPLTYFIIGYS
jgi:hypothetical protein